MKKLKLALFLLFASMIVLELFFDRDFAQIKQAVNKYRQPSGSFGQLTTDIKTIFAGGQISLGGIAIDQFKDRLIYVWTDSDGILHNSETMPKVKDFKVIKMGDLKLNSQKAMSKEEIEALLQAKP